MDPLSLTGTLIAVLQITTSVISICYDYRSGVASASRDAIQISDSLNALKDVLESLLRLIESSNSTGDSARLSNVEVLAKDGGIFETCLKEMERLKKKLEPEKGWRKVRKSLVWPLKEGEVKKALSALERFKSTMLLAISADQATLSFAIKGDLENLTDMFQKHTLDQTRQDIFKWLAAPDPFANHVLHRKKRHGSTGTWLLTSKQYDDWLHGRASFLVLYGIPGCGKTVLCSTVIEQFIWYTQQDESVGLAYYYFDFNETQKRDIASVLRSLITQLSSQCLTIPESLKELYDARHNGRNTIDEEAFLSILRSISLLFRNVYLVFDALDESPDCRATLQFIHRIKSWSNPKLHILVTSREITEIVDSLTPLMSSKVRLHDCDLNKDIHLYLDDRLVQDQKFSKWPLDVRKQVTAKLVQGEAGMFQWVVCQLEVLQRCLSVAAVRKALSTDLPKHLEGTYDQILSGVQQSSHEEASKILQALVATVEPMSLEEIVDIFAVDLQARPPRFDPDARLIDPQSIFSLCTSLITTATVSQLDFYDGYEEPVTVLKLAHASVAEYLIQPKPMALAQFHFSPRTAREMLCQTCLTYLMAPEFQNVSDRAKVVQNLERFPFLRHAVKYWPLYLKETEDPEPPVEEQTISLLQAFFASSKLANGGNFTFWVGLLIQDAPFEIVAKTQPLYYASSFGLLRVTKLLLETEKDIEIDALGGRANSSALHVAVYRNHIQVAKLLLSRGANPDVINIFGESAMFFAVRNDNQDMINLLLSSGATPLDERQTGEVQRSKKRIVEATTTRWHSSSTGSDGLIVEKDNQNAYIQSVSVRLIRQ